MVPHGSLSCCTDFKVLTSSSLVDMLNLQSYISSQCKPPDHSVLLLQFTVTMDGSGHLRESGAHLNFGSPCKT